MRNRKRPRSLYEMAVSAYMASYVRAGTTTEKPNMQLMQLWKSVPSLLVDTLVSLGTAEFIKLYVDNRMERPPNALSFVKIIVSPNMTVLDLSGLMCVPSHTCSGFVSLLNKSFCELQNLREICLRRHKREDTLPVCSNSTMRQIGKYCHNLKRLDVSNNGITSVGIKYLESCSLLEQLFLYGCIKVAVGDLKFLLTNLRELHMVGHSKLSSALRLLYTDNSKEHLKLTHVSALRELSANTWMLNSLCPELCNLRISIDRDDLVEMNYFPYLTSLELQLSTRPSIAGLTHVFALHKDQLTSVTISCYTLPISDVVPILAINCSNIEKLWLKCLKIESVDITHIGTLRFECLSSLYLHVECPFAFDSPVCLIHSILAHTQALKIVRLCLSTNHIDDAWMDTFLKKVNTESLTSFLLCSPRGGRDKFFLSMHSVHTILELCPQLTKLGNLKDWAVDPQEVEGLKEEVHKANYDLEIICRDMVTN